MCQNNSNYKNNITPEYQNNFNYKILIKINLTAERFREHWSNMQQRPSH